VSLDHQLAHLAANADAIQPPEGLAARLDEGRPLRVKLGLDPTAPAVTLGWAVVLRKLRQFQELGHTAVLIVGDFTAQVGDPSGKSETRRRLSAGEVRGYADALLGQFRKILLPDALEIRYNSEWLGALDMAAVLELTSKVTVAQMLERGDFAKRYETGTPISVMEFMYPLLQGYDSVAVRADVELGGADQLWNLMIGRAIQERYGMRPQVALTMPLLLGTDGEQKMSQSLGNYIGIDEPAEEMFGKTMSIPDRLIVPWWRLAVETRPGEVEAIAAGLADGSLHPNDTKRRLARAIAAAYWGESAAAAAEAAFDRVHRERRAPEEVPEYALPPDDVVFLPTVLRAAGLVESSAEARRLIGQGAVRLDGRPVTGPELPRRDLAGRVLQVGKRRFLRLVGGEQESPLRG
jgi:tyrosyl-tRNA synthetase